MSIADKLTAMGDKMGKLGAQVNDLKTTLGLPPSIPAAKLPSAVRSQQNKNTTTQNNYKQSQNNYKQSQSNFNKTLSSIKVNTQKLVETKEKLIEKKKELEKWLAVYKDFEIIFVKELYKDDDGVGFHGEGYAVSRDNRIGYTVDNTETRTFRASRDYGDFGQGSGMYPGTVSPKSYKAYAAEGRVEVIGMFQKSKNTGAYFTWSVGSKKSTFSIHGAHNTFGPNNQVLYWLGSDPRWQPYTEPVVIDQNDYIQLWGPNNSLGHYDGNTTPNGRYEIRFSGAGYVSGDAASLQNFCRGSQKLGFPQFSLENARGSLRFNLHYLGDENSGLGGTTGGSQLDTWKLNIAYGYRGGSTNNGITTNIYVPGEGEHGYRDFTLSDGSWDMEAFEAYYQTLSPAKNIKVGFTEAYNIDRMFRYLDNSAGINSNSEFHCPEGFPNSAIPKGWVRVPYTPSYDDEAQKDLEEQE
jgi:hypothetical protein